jgi:hypothetical protein
MRVLLFLFASVLLGSAMAAKSMRSSPVTRGGHGKSIKGKSSKGKGKARGSSEKSSSNEHGSGGQRRKGDVTRMDYPRPAEESYLDAGLKNAQNGVSKLFKMGRGLGKGTVDLLAGKHVYLDQILGKWRLMQDVDVGRGAQAIVSCPATIELCDGGEARSYFGDAECVTHFTFSERAWPKYCTVSFEAEAFQGPQDDTPVRMLYRGRFKKSILNPNVIFVRGSMFRVSRNVFGAKRKTRCGKFKMTRIAGNSSKSGSSNNSARHGKSSSSSSNKRAGGTGTAAPSRARTKPASHKKTKSS